MRFISPIVALIVLLSTAGVAVAAPKLRVAHDETADFSQYETYGWLEGDPAAFPELRRAFVAGIDRELQEAGLRKVDANRADLLVSIHVVMSTEGITTGSYNKIMRYDAVVVTRDARMFVEGSVVIDLVDAEAEKAIWQASVKAATNEYNYKRSRKRIEKVVLRMFEDFPPQ
jgi:hypothetical protein